MTRKKKELKTNILFQVNMFFLYAHVILQGHKCFKAQRPDNLPNKDA